MKKLMCVLMVALMFVANVNVMAEGRDTRLTVQVVDETTGHALQALVYVYSNSGYTDYVTDVYTSRSGRATIYLSPELQTVYLQVTSANYCLSQQVVALGGSRVSIEVALRYCGS